MLQKSWLGTSIQPLHGTYQWQKKYFATIFGLKEIAHGLA
jgi:hypothetical protein